MLEMSFTENETTELKGRYDESVKKSVVAFANTRGGTIFIGVADYGGVVGVTDHDDIILRVTNLIRDAIAPDVTLFTSADVVEIAGKQVIGITVEKGTASPYYIKSKGIRPEGVFVR